MGDIRYARSYEKVRDASDRAAAVRGLPDEEVIAALAAASREKDPLLANVLATEAQNRVARIQRTLDAMADAVLVLDAAHMRIASTNAAVERVFGVPPGELRGARPDRLQLDGERARRYVAHVERALARAETERFELTMRKADGSAFAAEHTIAPVYDASGEIVGVVDIVRDVDARKRAERREATTAEVSRLLAEGRPFAETAPPVLAALAHSIQAEFAEFWRFDPRQRVLRRIVSWHDDDDKLAAFDASSEGVEFGMGEGLPGTVAELQTAAWLDGLIHNARFSRGADASRAGLEAALGIPVRADERLLGTIVFLLRRDEEPDPETVRMLDASGKQVAAYLLRRTAQERFEGLLESAPDAVVLADEEDRILLVNPRFAAMFGLSPHEAEGNTLEHFLAPDAHERYRAEVSRASGGEVRSVTLPAQRADGTSFPIEMMLNPLPSEEASLLVFSIRDVSEREVAERALRESERRYRLLAENVSDMVTTSTPEGALAYVSPVALRMLGRENEDLIGHPLWDFTPPGERDELRAEHLRLLQAEAPRSVTHHLIDKAGTHVPVETRSRAVIDAESGRVVEIVSVTRDVTESRRTEELFRALLQTAPDAMVVVGEDGLIRLVNERAEQLFGYERAELLGKPIEVLMPERVWSRHIDERRRYSRHPHARPMGVGLPLFGRRKDGTEFPVEISLSPARTSEGTLVTAAIRDITGRDPRTSHH